LDRKAIFSFLIAGALLLSSCSGKKAIVVGSKNFTEQVVLGEIIAQHLEHRLQDPVKRSLNLSGTLLAQQALESGQIDMYPEYTGTAFMDVLKQQMMRDPAIILERVRSEYSSLGLDWLDPLGFNNSFAMVVRGQDARDRHLETLSDAAADRKGFVLGAGYEFFQRSDGFQALNSMYSVNWLPGQKIMDLGLLYPALLQKQVTMAAGSATDGLLSKLDVKVLKDDKNAFPPYQASIVVRLESETAHPGLKQALLELSGKIASAEMQKMNYAVDGEHKAVSVVAADFLKSKGL
jgi:glycine betaine/choline ABC-type transport system substrate-binding protein